MSHRSHLTRPAAVATAVTLGVSLAACGGTTKERLPPARRRPRTARATADPNAPMKEGLKIAFLPKQLNNPYSDVETSGGKEAVGGAQGRVQGVGPNDASASSQVSYINTLIQQQQDVIVIAANDPNAVCPPLNQARQAGIKVVTFDSDAVQGLPRPLHQPGHHRRASAEAGPA